MSLANPQLALAKAQEFLALLRNGWNEHRQRLEGDATAEMRGMLPLMRDIAARARPELVSAFVEGEPREDEYLNPVWRWVEVKEATQTLVGVLQNLNIREQILGPSGPTLAAEGLHPWVWHAAVDLWDAATDDLDRAEAQQAIQDAREVLEMTEWAHTGGREALREDLALANPTLREAPQHSREVAYVRAWSAFMSAADPDTVAAVEDYGSALGATGDASELVYEADIANELAIWQEAISAAEDALDAALGRVVSGSVAYDAFRDSLRESCQGAP